MTVLLFLPVLASADAVPWATEQYTATASSSGMGLNIQSGPPLPITVNWYNHVPYFQWPYTGNAAVSEITSSYMDVRTRSVDSDFTVQAIATFLGTYTAPSADPLFQFTYDGYYSSVVRPTLLYI